MTAKKISSESSEPSITVYTVIAVFSEDDILHATFESFEDINTFIKANVTDKKSALVFVTEGNLVPESQWRQPDEETNKYWVVV